MDRPDAACRGAETLAVAASLAAAGAFIARSAFTVGHRTYFSLFDDAMVSMRYARNLADGLGLVSNPHGKAVEGYTNLLWTLWMAVLHVLRIPENMISLAVMLSGALLLALNVVLVGGIARRLSPSRLAPKLAMWLTALSSIGRLRPDLVAQLWRPTNADRAALGQWGYQRLAGDVYVRPGDPRVAAGRLGASIRGLRPQATSPGQGSR